MNLLEFLIMFLLQVDLEYLLERYPLDKEVNWGNELSLGEQQRLGMARLFYHKPKFAILDECTSAVTIDMEERFCKKVRAMGTSCITISHRPALVAFPMEKPFQTELCDNPIWICKLFKSHK